MALLGATTDINEARSLSYRRDIVDIYSNSWGPADGGLYVGGVGPLTEKTLENGVKKVCSGSLSNRGMNSSQSCNHNMLTLSVSKGNV